MKELSKDVNGKDSSKRYWAKVFFTLGFWVFIFFIILWIITKFFLNIEFKIPEEFIDMWTWMMGFASAVVLGTVFEKPKDKNNKDKNCEADDYLDNVN